MPEHSAPVPAPAPRPRRSSLTVNPSLATSNSTTNHFLGTAPRSWMTAVSDNTSRALRSQVNGDSRPTHSRSPKHVQAGGEVNTTHPGVSSGDATTHSLSSSLGQQVHKEGVAAQTTTTPSGPEHNLQRSATVLSSPPSNLASPPATPSTTQAAPHPVELSAALHFRQSSWQAEVKRTHVQAPPPVNWNRWQSPDTLRFNAVQTTPSASAPIPAPVQAISPPSSLPGSSTMAALPNPAPALAPASRKRPAESQAQPPTSLRTRQQQAPSAALILLPSNFTAGLTQSLDQLRQQGHLSPIENSRFTSLHEACQCNDIMYLVIHQVFCLSSLQPGYLVALRFSPQEHAGIRVLNWLLVSNQNLSGPVLEYFMHFPQSPEVLSTPSYAVSLQLVRTFLAALGAHWEGLRDACLHRNCPPSPMELVTTFNVQSLIMQKTMFNALQRQMPAANHESSSQATILFIDEQRKLPNLPIVTHEMLRRDVEAFGQRYRALQHPEGEPSQPRPERQRTTTDRMSVRRPNPAQPVGLPQYARRHYDQYVFQVQPPVARSNARPLAPRNHTSVQPQSKSSALLPPPGYSVSYTTNPNPDRVALHQAHLRSPIPRKLDLAGNATPNLRLYQYVETLLLSPQQLDATTVFKEWRFNVPAPSFTEKTQDIPSEDPLSSVKSRLFRLGSTLFRLKAVATNESNAEVTSSIFNVATVFWPQVCFISINDTVDVETRRKQHYGRDLPADLTHLVVSGENVLQVSNHAVPEEANKTFYFAVEQIRVTDHTDAMAQPSRVSATESLASITSALKLAQDDEVSFLDTSVSIDLIDPFMATIFSIPVRGKHCKHRECFDLDAFLKSRTAKVKNGPTNPDQWFCPICKKDARPFMLVIDEFLVEVRKDLQLLGELDAKAIIVKADGKWVPKFDKEKDQEKRKGSSPKQRVVPLPHIGGQINSDGLTDPQAAPLPQGTSAAVYAMFPGLVDSSRVMSRVDLDGMLPITVSEGKQVSTLDLSSVGTPATAQPNGTSPGTSTTAAAVEVIVIDDD